MRTQFRLQIPPRLLRRYQERYNVNADPKLDHLRDVSRHPGYLTVNQLYELCQWKSHRRPALARTNSAEFVREITAFAFKTPSEEARIAALTLLAGVSYPTASVILHFCVDDSYLPGVNYPDRSASIILSGAIGRKSPVKSFWICPVS